MTNCIIIDGHTHIYDNSIAEKIISSFTDFYKMNPVSTGKGTASHALENMRRGGINYTVIANFAPQKGICKSNDSALRTASQHTGFIPLISVYPGMPLKMIDGYVKSGAKGIKMHTGIQNFEPFDKGLRHIYEYCAEARLTVTFHCGETSKVHVNDLAAISHILPVVERYPDIPFVLTHMAAGEPETVFFIAETFKNVYFDTSITVTGEHCIDRIHNDFWENDSNTAAAFREIGCGRITFGSDYPFGNPISDMDRILKLRLSDDEKSLILGKNTAALYNIV